MEAGTACQAVCPGGCISTGITGHEGRPVACPQGRGGWRQRPQHMAQEPRSVSLGPALRPSHRHPALHQTPSSQALSTNLFWEREGEDPRGALRILPARLSRPVVPWALGLTRTEALGLQPVAALMGHKHSASPYPGVPPGRPLLTQNVEGGPVSAAASSPRNLHPPPTAVPTACPHRGTPPAPPWTLCPLRSCLHGPLCPRSPPPGRPPCPSQPCCCQPLCM